MDQWDVDVLIFGGGVMGLWFQKDLSDAGFSAVLLEVREPGCVQTCHSHVYVHQGFIYNKKELRLTRKLGKLRKTWAEWIERHPETIRSRRSYFGFRNDPEFLDKLALWSEPRANMKCESVDESQWPDALRGGAVRKLVATGEHTLDGTLLVQALCQSAPESRIVPVSGSEPLLVSASETGIQVVASSPVGGEIRINTRRVVLAAGAGNPALAKFFRNKLGNGVTRVRQQIRKGHMLVIRGNKKVLPPLTGVFPSFGGLFIVSRELPEENVWLVSDNRSPAVPASEDWIRFDSRSWLPLVKHYLFELSPLLEERASKLRWGIYEAPKAERVTREGSLPNREYIKGLGEDVWAVWPTKLTLAPQASKTLLEKLKLGTAKTGRRPGERHDGQLEPAPERWRITSMDEWDDFRQIHGIRGDK